MYFLFFSVRYKRVLLYVTISGKRVATIFQFVCVQKLKTFVNENWASITVQSNFLNKRKKLTKAWLMIFYTNMVFIEQPKHVFVTTAFCFWVSSTQGISLRSRALVSSLHGFSIKLVENGESTAVYPQGWDS